MQSGRDNGASGAALPDFQMSGNVALQQLDMADDADHAAAAAHAFQNVHGIVDGAVVQGAKALVNK